MRLGVGASGHKKTPLEAAQHAGQRRLGLKIGSVQDQYPGESL